MHAGLQQRGVARDDCEYRHDARQGQQHNVIRTKPEMQWTGQPYRGDRDRRGVSPMLAIAEPKARLRLTCSRPRRAARNAATVSGERLSIERDDERDFDHGHRHGQNE